MVCNEKIVEGDTASMCKFAFQLIFVCITNRKDYFTSNYTNSVRLTSSESPRSSLRAKARLNRIKKALTGLGDKTFIEYLIHSTKI